MLQAHASASPESARSQTRVRPLGPDIQSVQPGAGPVARLELAWGRLRRRYLRRFRPGYVQRMRALRRGSCAECAHDIVDPRDLKYYRNVCGFSFPQEADRFGWRGKLGLARMGLAEVLVTGVPLFCASLIAWRIAPLLAVPPLLLLIWAIAFFRDPRRSVPSAPGLILSPADGRVDDVGELEYFEPLGGPALRVGIFLSLFDVHLNRAPAHARALELSYRRGEHRATYRVGALEDNEQLVTLFACEEAPYPLLVVRQIAGPAARRIVCELRPGQFVARGERFGLIKFGSRTELYLPRTPELRLEIQRGRRVRAGSTVLARMLAG